MRPATRVLGAAALAVVLLASAPDAGSAGGPTTGRLRIVRPRSEGPGGGEVRLLRGAGADAVRRIWFGDHEAPATHWNADRGLEIVLPSGYLERGQRRKRVPVRVEFEDGRTRSLGRFLYRGYPRYRRRSRVGSERGVGDPFDPIAFFRTSARVERLGGGLHRYRYELTNGSDDVVQFRWEVLELVGLPGGWSVTLQPWETATLVRELPGIPVEVDGGSEISGSSFIDAYGLAPALAPASSIPFIPPVEDLTHFEDPDGNEVLQWAHPDPGALDTIDIYGESLDGEGWVILWGAADTSITIPRELLGPGLTGISVVPSRWGLGARYGILGVVR